MNLLTVSQVARQIESNTGLIIPPQRISNLFYRRILDGNRCPIVGRFRLIPVDYVPEVERALNSGEASTEEVPNG
jgi:hypothetical protein